MGEVYRAEDTNLSREVAIKVLPEQFTKDPQRLARFEREAKLLASLNHPNIAAIYGFEEADELICRQKWNPNPNKIGCKPITLAPPTKIPATMKEKGSQTKTRVRPSLQPTTCITG